ncbi:MAG: hypothetical protein NT085_00660 [candidate division SR1 bacterium]|nr:hypothetical protein [candidate division SR1 bacterium]
MVDFTINVQLDLEKDARNYRRAFNANTHAIKRKEQVAQITIIDLNKISGMSEHDTYIFLRDYLEQFWENNKQKAEEKIKTMQETLDLHQQRFFVDMEKLTKHSIYRNDFTIFLTSLNRGPYNYSYGYTWSYIDWDGVCRAFVHELLHFQTIHYYKEHIMSRLHDEKKFEDLKESLTFLLNYALKDSIEGYDMGYPQHQELRKKLEDYRVHSDKDFDKLIDYGCDILAKE